MDEDQIKLRAIAIAKENYAEMAEIDTDAKVSIGEDGAWVQAWVFVSSDQIGMDDD